MSHRMCAKCKRVVNNRVFRGDSCPKCDSKEWADPNEHNDEWSMICKLQFENLALQTKLGKAVEALEAIEAGGSNDYVNCNECRYGEGICAPNGCEMFVARQALREIEEKQ